MEEHRKALSQLVFCQLLEEVVRTKSQRTIDFEFVRINTTIPAENKQQILEQHVKTALTKSCQKFKDSAIQLVQYYELGNLLYLLEHHLFGQFNSKNLRHRKMKTKFRDLTAEMTAFPDFYYHTSRRAFALFTARGRSHFNKIVNLDVYGLWTTPAPDVIFAYHLACTITGYGTDPSHPDLTYLITDD
jgi:hypothetical protein